VEDGDDPQRLLAVVYCAGTRCDALRRLAEERHPDHPTSVQLLKEAVSGRRASILVASPCPGLCAHGAVVTAGWASSSRGSHRLVFEARPTTLGRTEIPDRAEAVAAWLREGAPDAAALGPALAERQRI
jgi:hypothetical protein